MKTKHWFVLAMAACVIGVLAAAGGGGNPAAAAGTVDVSSARNITNTGDASGNGYYERDSQLLKASSGIWYLIYSRSQTSFTASGDPDQLKYDIYYQTSTDNGATWSSAAKVLDAAAISANASFRSATVTEADGKIWVIGANIESLQGDIYATTYSGGSWSAQSMIFDGTYDTGAFHLDAVAEGDDIRLFYGIQNESKGVGFIKYHGSTDTWDSSVTEIGAAAGYQIPRVIKAGSTYYLVSTNWDNILFTSTTTPDTVPWPAAKSVVGAPSGGAACDPSILKYGASGGTDDLIVFTSPCYSDGSQPVEYVYSTDAGSTWSSPSIPFTDAAHGGQMSWDMMSRAYMKDANTAMVFFGMEQRGVGHGQGDIVVSEWNTSSTIGNPHYTTIQDGVTNANSGDTISVAAGTYTEAGQIVIDKNLSIVGAGASQTIIKPAGDTSSSGDARGWFLVNDGVTFNLSDVTLDGTGHKVWQAIRDKGQGSISDCAFTNIKYEESGPSYAGTAIAAFGAGGMNVDVANCTFTGIGRVGVLYYGSGVTGSTFSGNTYTGKGAGNWLDYAVEVGAGAHATATRNTISGNTGVASVDGSTSAGILVTTYYGSGTQATITENFISGSTAGVAIGYNASDTSAVTVFNNSLTANTKGVDSAAPLVDASGNWWGTKTPAGVAGQVSANVDYTPWLDNGTDKEPGTPGFQGDFSTLNVDDDSPQSGAIGRVQEGVNMVSGSTVNVAAGTYAETIDVDGRTNINVAGANRDTVIVKPASTLCWNVGGYGCSRQAAVRVVGSTGINFSNMTFDFDLVKGNNVAGVFYWDSTGTLNHNVLKNMSVPDASGGYYELTSYIRAPSYSDGARAPVTFSDNIFTDTGRLGIVTHDFVQATIQGNTFTKTTHDFGYAMEIGSRSTATVTDNTISGYDTPAASDGSESAGIYVENSFTNGLPHINKPVTISGNTLTGNQYGLYIGNEWDGYAGDIDINVTLQNNEIHDNTTGGVFVADEDRENGSSVTLNASGNTVSNNGNEGYHFFTYKDGEIHAAVSDDTITGQQTGVLVDECVYPYPPPPRDNMCPTGASASLYDVVIGPNNDISNDDTGVGVFSVPGITVQGNQIHHNVNRSGYAGVGIMFWGDSDNEQVLNNVVHDNDRQGIFLGHDTAISTGSTISGNTIYNNGRNTNPNPPDASAYGIQLWNADDNTISNNEIYGHDDWFPWPGYDFDFAQGIYLYDSNGNFLSGNYLHNNNYGVGLWGPGRGNGTNLINFNDISGNTGYGVRSFDTLTVNAENNWWGACSGPYHPTANPSGTGDAVSDNVDFTPWITGPCDSDGDGLSDDQETKVVGTDPLNADTDGDGCRDGREYLLMPGFNPRASYWYDFYDVPVPVNADPTPNGSSDRAINLQDVVAVLKYVGASENGPANGAGLDYDSIKGSCHVNGHTAPDKEGLCYDRSPGLLPNPPYDAGPPDGVVNLQDVVVALRQVGLDCSGPP
jgi:parallel beta-helix repeat protein